MKRRLRKYRYPLLITTLVLSVVYYFCLPDPLFDDPYATVLNDESGHLLSARIANDGQWRFPQVETIPEKYEKALLTFEDQHFYKHPGVNPLALGRAVIQNLKTGRVVSGGSTISMQVIRLARKGKGRNIFQKLIEMVQATRLELRYSKAEILNIYASHAPFGGNTVGLETAAWRYYGSAASQLSWSEAALFAVLPNQPSLLFPGKNEQLLKEKRDRLLDRLYEEDQFDLLTLELAKSEPLPLKPNELPMLASHLLDRAALNGQAGKQIESTLQRGLQARVNKILESHSQVLKANGVNNAAAVVLNVRTGEAVTYVGNVPVKSNEHGQQVDIIRAPRSTGSLLKPMLYASMLNEGLMLPNTLLPDVPMTFGGFSPKNFSRTYDGAIGAKMALARSLNMPAVHLLQQYGYPKFHSKLKSMGMSTLNKPADHYGLSLILGGSEATLWDLTNIYAGMARTLNNYHARAKGKRYNNLDFDFSTYNADASPKHKTPIEELRETGELSAASIWFTFQAMLEVYRPAEDASWELFSSSDKIAWKTGTSFGHRDAWAIGVTADYVVGVWAGNADGEGRPNLTGITAAAPIMFDIFDLLPSGKWFVPPMDEMVYAAVDRQSGYLASPYSIAVDTVLIPKTGLTTQISPFHQAVHLDESRAYRVNGDCEPVRNMEHQNWFVLPPRQANYYKTKNPTYQELPPWRTDCYGLASAENMMEVVYPRPESEVYLPINIDGEEGEMIFEVAHRNPKSQLHWHLDDAYIGSTLNEHELSFRPTPGQHLLTIMDDRGNSVKRSFKVLSKVGD